MSVRSIEVMLEELKELERQAEQRRSPDFQKRVDKWTEEKTEALAEAKSFGEQVEELIEADKIKVEVRQVAIGWRARRCYQTYGRNKLYVDAWGFTEKSARRRVVRRRSWSEKREAQEAKWSS